MPGRIRPPRRRARRRASRPRRPGRGRPAPASPPPRSRPRCARPRSTSARTSSGLSPRGSPTSTRSAPSDACAASTNGRAASRSRNERGRRAPTRSTRTDADPVAAPQARRRVHQQQRAAHDPDPVAEPLRLVEVVRADHDRAAGVAQGGDEVADRLGGRWIERARRLVEVQHLRLVEERAGDRHLLAHPLAEAADAPVAASVRPTTPRYRSTARRRFAPRSPYRRP